jgi:hypothetical protein
MLALERIKKDLGHFIYVYLHEYILGIFVNVQLLRVELGVQRALKFSNR